jgi:hypothetical protein
MVDILNFVTPSYGTFFVLGSYPAMNRWAIFGRPYGTSDRDPFVSCPGQSDDDLNPFHRNKRETGSYEIPVLVRCFCFAPRSS